MAKGLKYGLICLITLLVIGFLALTLTIDSIVKSNIEKTGSEMTGTAVTVDNVSISPFSGEGTIRGFRVANPNGYITDYAIEIDEFYIHLDVYTLFTDRVEVHEIRINGPAIYVEQKLRGNNLRTILNNMNDYTESQPAAAEMAIGYFLMEDGSADLHTEVGGERSARVEMSSIELHNVGTDNDRQAADQVITQIADRVFEQALHAAVRSGAEQIEDALRDIFN